MTFGIDMLKTITNKQQKREKITKSQSQNNNTELDGQQEEASDFPEHLGTHQTWAVVNCSVDCVWMKKNNTGLVSVQCFCILPLLQQSSHGSVSRDRQVHQCELHGNRPSIPGMSTMTSLMSIKAQERQVAAYECGTKYYVKGTMPGHIEICANNIYLRAFP